MNPKNEWFKLSKNVIYFIFAYYIIFISLSSFAIYLSLNENLDKLELINFKETLLCSIYFSVLGATTFYIRKLYKACINLDIKTPITEEDKTRQIGVVFYFCLRPLFATIFSVFTIFAIKSGINALAEGKLDPIRFFYFCTLISFIIGYSCGKYIDNLEKAKEKLLEKIGDVKL